jgi:S1-C subfamily serine protease
MVCALGMAMPWTAPAADDNVRVIQMVKGSVVAVGTFLRTRNPAFAFRGTGFVVGDGLMVATNSHVLPKALNSEKYEVLAIAIPQSSGKVEIREATRIRSDPDHDLALLRTGGAALPALKVSSREISEEGGMVLFTGYPLGTGFGVVPVTHRAMISAITPIVTPAENGQGLNAEVVRRIARGAYSVYQLDGTAYPGNSGSPLFDPETGEVLGIVNMVFVKGSKEAAISEPSGISYAIPATYLYRLMQ